MKTSCLLGAGAPFPGPGAAGLSRLPSAQYGRGQPGADAGRWLAGDHSVHGGQRPGCDHIAVFGGGCGQVLRAPAEHPPLRSRCPVAHDCLAWRKSFPRPQAITACAMRSWVARCRASRRFTETSPCRMPVPICGRHCVSMPKDIAIVGGYRVVNCRINFLQVWRPLYCSATRRLEPVIPKRLEDNYMSLKGSRPKKT